MTRELNGRELQQFIKVRQLRQVRNLRQEHDITPKLLIVMSKTASDVIATYVRMKRRYARDILIDVEMAAVEQSDMISTVQQANDDASIQGIIVQLPLDDPAGTSEICNAIAPEKDVDGLGERAIFPSATAQAIDWLLAGYDVDLVGKVIAIVGRGKLVGAPLAKLWGERGLNITVFDDQTPLCDMQRFDVIVTATGVPRLITSDMIKPGAVVVDAGTASEHGKLIGDVDDSVRAMTHVTMTPKKGGVGPLTYTVLFDHLIENCLKRADKL